jgi:hypothetical protein
VVTISSAQLGYLFGRHRLAHAATHVATAVCRLSLSKPERRDRLTHGAARDKAITFPTDAKLLMQPSRD